MGNINHERSLEALCKYKRIIVPVAKSIYLISQDPQFLYLTYCGLALPCILTHPIIFINSITIELKRRYLSSNMLQDLYFHVDSMM